MKAKLVIVFMFIMVLFVFHGCKSNESPQQPDPPVTVLTPEDVFPQEILNQLRFDYNILNRQVEITYFGNHGYMFSTNSRQVLIDVHTEVGEGYERTSRVINTMLNDREFPFDSIELSLTTHSHGDHFDTDIAVDFLIANDQTHHLSTQEVASLIQNHARAQQVGDRSQGITPNPRSRTQTDIGGVSVDVIRINHHGADDDYQHVAYMFTLNGIKILHVGDACKILAEYQTLGLEGENIDILIAPYGSSCSNWCETFEDQDAFEVIRQYIRPKHIILSHLAFDSTAADAANTMSRIQTGLPGQPVSVFHPEILKQKIFIKEGNNIRVIDKPAS